jgi:hypothetical protein
VYRALSVVPARTLLFERYCPHAALLFSSTACSAPLTGSIHVHNASVTLRAEPVLCVQLLTAAALHMSSSLALLPVQAADATTIVPEPSTSDPSAVPTTATDSPTVLPTVASTVLSTAVPGLGTTVTVSTRSHAYTI